MAEAPQVADTSPHDWMYISEGGSTIVFSYTGPPHPKFDGRVLRLRKCPVQTHEDPQGHQRQSQLRASGGADTEEDEPDDPTIVFQRTVIERLVPREYLPRLDAVRVGRMWLQQLAELTEQQRPLERRAKDEIDFRRRKAVLATDLVGGEGWAVEIKPKWGFLPSSTHLSPETRAIKARTCRFCMHTHLRRTQGSGAHALLGYCPLDLFSRDRARVTAALHALWDAWIGSGAAVNNLRVFVEGETVKPTSDPESLSPLARQLLPLASAHTPPPNELRTAFVLALLPLLLDTPVLHTLAMLQRTLDALDVEGLAALWARLRPADAHALGKGEVNPDAAEWARVVDAYLVRQGAAGDAAELEATEEELRYRLATYLLSASFKDCSVILRMQPSRTSEADVRSKGSITVIDLDVKSIDRLSKWAKLDREIVDAYRNNVTSKDCLDNWAV